MTELGPQPIDAALVPRFAGLPTFMRLPVAADAHGLDIALVGVPFDGGTTNRPGARHGPREVRNQSSLMRRVHQATGVSPYDLVRVGDLGDAPVNPMDLPDTLHRIQGFFAGIAAAGATALAVGGDHLVSLPILRALRADAPLGMVHFDAHSDTNDRYFGDNRYTHGTPFRRAVEEGLLDPRRVVQVGLRGSLYDPSDTDWARANGIRMVPIEEVMARGIPDVMAEARAVVGAAPCYVSFDIDVIDPAMAPGTGTPEIGGLLTREAQQAVRLLDGVAIRGADVVEVSPPWDPTGMTALAGATVLFEILCVTAAHVARTRTAKPAGQPTG